MRRARITICAAAAAAILGTGLIAAPPNPAPISERSTRALRAYATYEACVVRAQESGYCVIPGRAIPQQEAPAAIVEREDVPLDTLEDLPVERVHRRRPATNTAHEAEDARDAEAVALYTAPSEDARYLGRYTITGYDICMSCCGKTDGITYSGTQATVGRTCAAPWDIPIGTRLYIEGIGERIVEDRGGLGTSKIDVLCEDHAACYAITREIPVDVWILED